MTLDQAFAQLVETAEYKDIAKTKDSLGGKYRSYLSLYNKGELKVGAIASILTAHGYTITANKAVKKK